MSKLYKNQKIKFGLQGFLHFKSFFNNEEIKKNHLKIVNFAKKIKKHNRVLNAHNEISGIYKLYRNKKLVNFAEYLLENKINGLQSELFINPPGSKGHPPHQDDFFLGTGIGNSLNVWIPLVNTNKLNGTLNFYKKKEKIKIDKTLNIKSLNGKKINLTKYLKYKKTINCKVGDAVFISNSIFHGSHDNKSKNKRFVVAFGFIKKGKKFHKGKTAKRKITKLN